MNPKVKKGLVIWGVATGITVAALYPRETSDSGRKSAGIIGNGLLVACNVIVDGLLRTDLCPDANITLGGNQTVSSPDSGTGSNESANNNDGRVYITPGGVACAGVIDTVIASSNDSPISIASGYDISQLGSDPSSYRAVGGEVIHPGEEVVIC